MISNMCGASRYVPLEEFDKILEFLCPDAEDGEDAEDAEDAEASTIAAKFIEYDTNGDGRIDFDETKAMMEKLGYRVTDKYLDGLMDAFATFDDINYPRG